MKKRSSGILHHITSLPSPYGIGDLGPEAYRFADFLAAAKQSYWQILPLNPTDPEFDSSPYHSTSSCARNPLLISLDQLVQDCLLKKADCAPIPAFPANRVDYQAVIAYKERLFALAYERFCRKKSPPDYERFCFEAAAWLDDYALFSCLQNHFKGKLWNKWPAELRDRHPEALDRMREKLRSEIDRVKFLQFVCTAQWCALKRYCNRQGIKIFGDIPIYVDFDSVDVWAHPDIFKLDESRNPVVVAGVPPDYFSATGQLWGNPIYRWDVLQQRGYDWWIKRLEHNFYLFDLLRIDHFRGLVAYWEVPAKEKTAINGRWIEAPVVDFFNHLSRKLPYLPVVAEDLGIITPDVREVMQQFDLPGMKVLMFAFGGDLASNPYVPHNVVKNAIIYTGTHDNNTVRGWFENEATPEEKQHLFRYLGRQVSSDELPRELIRLAMMSVATVAIIPTQDILGLGQEARMNKPSTAQGNWRWRIEPGRLTDEHAARLRELTETYGRA